MSELDSLWIVVDGVPQVGFLTKASYDNYPYPNAFSVKESEVEDSDIISQRTAIEELINVTERNKREEIITVELSSENRLS